MSEHTTSLAEEIAFGPFRLIPAQRVLLEEGTPVRLGSRARDILLTLVERPGELVSKDELIARVWPNTFVEDGNLKVHVAALRRALGDGQNGQRYITNVPGRGYSFVAPVAVSVPQTAAVPAATPTERPRDLPAPLARMIGRSDTVSALQAMLRRHRFLTIVGPGGIGKTTVAVTLADRLLGEFPDGVRFVDLAPLGDPHLVPAAVAAALGVGVRSDDPIRALVSFVQGKRMLILLDSCEHVVDTAATLAEQLFASAGPELHILATSREPLRVEGEHVHRLSPLACPPSLATLTAADALTFPAIQLFVERAAAGFEDFVFTDAEAPIVADLCRRLDGMALAIEIAAGRIDTFGVAGLATRLDDRFRLLLRGRRTAMPRHQTLSTTLDWSYALLPDVERAVLRRLSVLAGNFTMNGATGVLVGPDATASEVVDAVANLVAKSLVSATVEGPVAFYRLLDITRAYASAKLSESGERMLFERRHADYMRGALDRAASAWERQPAAEWLQDHRHMLDNVRTALDWAFSPNGDPALGVALTIGAVPLWFQSSLIAECGERVRRALASSAAGLEPHFEMQLYAAQAWSLMQTKGSVGETQTAWSRTLELAEASDDADYQLRALWGLWAGLLNRSELRAALALAERFTALAQQRSTSADVLVGDRLIGYILHLLGQQTEARRHLDRIVTLYTVPTIGAQMIRFIFDQQITARCFLARILWLQGFPDQAMKTAEAIIRDAKAGGDMLTLCQALVQAACPVSIFNGDLGATERYVGMLVEEASRNTLEFWQVWGRCFQGVLLIRRGDLEAGLLALGAALKELRDIQYGVYYIVFLAEYAEALGGVGRVSQGMTAVDDAIARSEQNQERWYACELLRIKGELLLRNEAADGAVAAQRLFEEALGLARAQETRAWELRVAISMARLWSAGGRHRDALTLLAPIRASFAPSAESADLHLADTMLVALAGEAQPPPRTPEPGATRRAAPRSHGRTRA